MNKSVIVAGGLDPSGGAGLASDIKVCAFFNVYPLPVLTALTYQNSTEFFGFEVLKLQQVETQLKSILDYYSIEVAKIGLTGRGEILDLLVSTFYKKGIKTVLDPVLKTSTKGKVSDNALVDSITQNAGKIYLITPNIPEAKELTKLNSENQQELGELLKNKGFKNILIKGGHLKKPYDLLLSDEEKIVFKGERIETENSRGTGCALSSAIASNLASGKTLKEAIAISKNYLTEAMRHNYKLGNPPYPLNLLLR
ncbi:hydroxymethylpyrimidine/phosphomethylpyrimidine kinase [Thermotomaculum hydrothermale]|uniref:hydroxymethylpyrimidine kinase n=1 Tax=Thermotomaculum hydrothermale TaxID=981385 RepID=A0A7R6PQ03_9BACT|nr:hydroxymethylpyrimidine/phosphomethylpyrimidine kinase [Thermotomaculum hydrothermale]BBB33186.1 hydroxymethylpyrimidine/phosphomethylpyrimidine kinase [Thermotomaculum hydrothermale]